MKMIKSALFFLITMALFTASPAWAGREHGYGHPHLGFSIGVPLGFGVGFYGVQPYYPVRTYYPVPLYYGAYRQVYVPQVQQVPQPPAWVEQGPQQEAGQDQAGFWYYCNNPQGYYPNVQQCPSGWNRVTPQR